jgi:hypothetical protein
MRCSQKPINWFQKESVRGGPSRHPQSCPSLCTYAADMHTWTSAGLTAVTATLFEIGYDAGRGFLHGRMVFPIHDQQGSLVAYAGRSLDNSEPRYLFPPGFHKSWVVYNLHRALGAAPRQAGRGIGVEGFFDCLKVHQAGYANVVALMGASLSDVQAKLLEQHFRDLALMLDGDEAGRRASRVIAARLEGMLTLHIAPMPEGGQLDQLSPTEIQRILCEWPV